jgi:hypothetical protein
MPYCIQQFEVVAGAANAEQRLVLERDWHLPQYRLQLPVPFTTDRLTVRLLKNHADNDPVQYPASVPKSLMGIQVYG